MTETTSELRTFLIADVRGYTQFTQEYGDESAARLTARFADLTEEVVTSRGGRVIELRGDEALATFTSTRQALRAALDLQQRVGGERDREQSLPLQVGIGLDAGEAVPLKGGYRGGALNLAARLCNLAGPGEVLASEEVAHLAGKIDGVSYEARGAVQLKGFAAPVRVVRITSGAALADESATGGGAVLALEAVPRTRRDLPIGGFLGSLPAGPLVARSEELRQVLLTVDAVAGGDGRLVLLAGEPGIGKTRLAQEVTLAVRNHGFVVATGRCYEPQQGVAFYPFLEALAAMYAEAPSVLRYEAIRRWPFLARLLPDQVEMPATAMGEPQEEQLRLFRAVSSFLQAVAEVTPAALLLDDLHWADASSLALLQHLARHTRGDRILLLGTYRDVEVSPDHPLERALLDLSRERLLERVRLRRLAENGTQEMMAATLGRAELSADLVDLVHNRTDGNPFFVEEVVRALVEQGDLYREDGRWVRRETTDVEVPESVRSVVGQRVARLSEATQEVLLEASIFGPAFTFDELQSVSDRSDAELEVIVEEAMAAGLLQETKRDGYAFNHALTQHTLYARLSSRRRRRLHLAAGEALEGSRRGRTRRAAELAWHFLEGDDPVRALTYSLLAGDEAEVVFAHAEAERHYRNALELAQGNGDQPQEAEALEKLGGVYQTIARYDESIEMLQAAARLSHDLGERIREARVGVQLAWSYRGKGASDQGVQVVQSLLERLEPDARPADLAELYIVLETLYFATARYVEGLAAAERAAELARAAGDQKVLVRAEVGRGTELSMLGRDEESLRILEAALPFAAVIEDDPRTRVRLLINLGNSYGRRGQYSRARNLFVEAAEIYERMGNPWGLAFALSNLGSTDRDLGQWDRARTVLDRAVALSRAATGAWWAPYPLLEFGGLLTDQGDWEAARDVLTEATELGGRNQDLQVTRAASRFLAEVDIATGRAQEALSRLEPILDRPGLQEGQVTALLPVLAAAHLAVGDAELAERTVGDALRRARSDGQRLVIAEALLVRSRLMTALDRTEEAAHDLEEVVRLARDMAHPLLEGRALLASGLLDQQRGNVPAAQEALEAALAIFRRLGARADIKEVERALSTEGTPLP